MWDRDEVVRAACPFHGMMSLVSVSSVGGEPPAGPWRVQAVSDVLATLLAGLPSPATRIPVVAVDGRSASGKTTLAERLRMAASEAVVVHTDDVAWHHSFFGWSDLLVKGVLEPVHRGQLPVRYRPPAWEERCREGAIEVPVSCRLLIVEGVGAGRRELTNWTDALVWVQSDVAEARRRGIARDGGDAAAEHFWGEWDAEELPFLAEDRPWERADLVVAGTPRLPYDPHTQVVAADPRRRSPATLAEGSIRR